MTHEKLVQLPSLRELLPDIISRRFVVLGEPLATVYRARSQSIINKIVDDAPPYTFMGELIDYLEAKISTEEFRLRNEMESPENVP